MGSDKALVPFQGLPMIQQVAAALRRSDLEVLVVGRDSVAGLDAIPDLPGHKGGPAVGLLSAFNHLATDVLLVAVDQPLLRPETAQELLARPGDAVVPQADGHPQVTCALFRRSCYEPLRELLAAGETKLRRLLDRVDATLVAEDTWSKWGEDGRSWMSLDTPQAVRDAEALPWRP
jgi:molybdopterin-guanine dinucleotide biosynthesis protein A